MYWVAIVLTLLMMILIWQIHEGFAAVVDPEQYVNSTLVAKF